MCSISHSVKSQFWQAFTVENLTDMSISWLHPLQCLCLFSNHLILLHMTCWTPWQKNNLITDQRNQKEVKKHVISHFTQASLDQQNQHIVTGTVTRLRAGQSGIQSKLGQEHSLSSPTWSHWLSDPPWILFVALSPGPGPECEADHSSPSSVKVKNIWNYTSTPPECLHSIEWHNLTCYLQQCLILKFNWTKVSIHTKQTYLDKTCTKKWHYHSSKK
jgi:hypothetical protein